MRRTNLHLFAVIGVTMLAGCNAPAFKAITPEEASAAPTDKLCESYADLAPVIGEGPRSRNVIRAELTKRGAMSDADWGVVAAGRLRRGLNKCIVLAMYGTPLVVSEASMNIESMAFAGGAIVVGFQNGSVVNFTAPPQ